MYGKMILILLTVGLGLLPLSPVFAKEPGVLLQEGMYSEDVDGNLEAAMNSYRQVVQSPQATDAQASHALYRLGLCQMKLQQNSQAAATFQQIIERYPDQTTTIEKVRPLLAELVVHDPATLMPADTKVYVEFGSPGRQIQTILNMLKGTPLENPLQAFGAGGPQGQSAGPNGNTPPDLISSMLNPSMMAEFKKIRGMAIGLSQINMNDGVPTFVGVMDPGKSDALRGLVLMALGMFGQPGDPIEGMQTFRIQPDSRTTIHVAHDNNIILIAHPLEQFQWCVRKYKGLIQEPSLATQNPTFSRIPRQQRSQNAVTLWMDGAGVYSQIPESVKRQMEFQIVNHLADLSSLRDVLSQFSLKEQGLVSSTEINFQEGHHCLPYQILHTPNLTKDGFEGVPADAIGLMSVALGNPQGPLASQAQQAVRELTGLDIGRELFANIEQVTLFAMPPGAAAEQGALSRELSPLIHCAGLAITSHNPQKTRQLLSQLLVVGEIFFNMHNQRQRQLPAEQVRDKYYLADSWDREHNKAVPVYLHIGQAGKTTVLSLNREIIDASLAAVRTKQSVATGGPLYKTLSLLPDDTSKLALVNVGGAIQLGAFHLQVAEFGGQTAQDNPTLNNLRQLADACRKTSVLFRTGETANRFTMQTVVDELPPLGTVFPLFMHMAMNPQPNAHLEATGRQDNVIQQAEAARIATIKNALMLFELDCGRLPTQSEGLDALLNPPAGVEDWKGPYLEERNITDSWKHSYQYTPRSTTGKDGFTLVSLGRDGVPGGQGANADITIELH